MFIGGCHYIIYALRDPDHIPKMFSILDPVRTRDALEPFEKLTYLELFQSLASELISPNFQIHFSNEADFGASVVSAYRY
jgi:hypothetical protein